MEKHRTNLTWALVPEEPPEAMLAKMCEASLAMEVLLDDTRFACERALWEAAIAYVKEHLQVSAENVLTQALRYQHLRGVDLDKVYVGGVFVGLTPENIVLNGEELDQAVDAAIAGQPIPAGKREGYAWAAAVDNLRRHQVQQDNDGIAVTVSREALEQVLALFPKVPPQP